MISRQGCLRLWTLGNTAGVSMGLQGSVYLLLSVFLHVCQTMVVFNYVETHHPIFHRTVFPVHSPSLLICPIFSPQPTWKALSPSWA